MLYKTKVQRNVHTFLNNPYFLSQYSILPTEQKRRKRERTHGHEQQCGDCWGWGVGAGEVDESIGKINGNGKVQ